VRHLNFNTEIRLHCPRQFKASDLCYSNDFVSGLLQRNDKTDISRLILDVRKCFF
jgi:hypothetical protein